MQMEGFVLMKEHAKRKKLMENIIVSIGSPLLDIIVNVDEAFLKKYNLKSNGTTHLESNNFKLFTEISKMKHEDQPGGSVTNTARIIQKLAAYPNTSCHIGCVGCDREGEIIKNVLKSENVNFIYQEVDNEPTGICAVLVSNNNKYRSLVTYLGASKLLDDDVLVNKSTLKIVKKAKFFYIAGYIFAVSPMLARKIGTLCHEKKKMLVFNIGASFLCITYKSNFLDLMPEMSLLFGNEDEARALAKVLQIPDESITDIAVKLSGFRKKFVDDRIVVITRGPSPVVVAIGKHFKEYPVEHVKDSKIVDTAGAGDAFVGGFLSQFIEDKSIDECISCGMFAARECLKHHGINFEFSYAKGYSYS